jgi:hypothetical protein
MVDGRPFRFVRAASIAAALCMGSTALSQVSVQDLEAQLAGVRRQLASPAPAARLELVARLDDIERRLIAAAPTDDRVATWLVDRAAAALDQAGRGDADLSVLFGVPTAAELAHVRARAEEAVELADQADQAAARSVARLEAELVGGADPAKARARAEAVERTLHTLVDVEQGQRIPYIRALATALLGAGAKDEPARETAQAAVRQLGALAPSAGPLADARALALGASHIHASIGARERAGGALKAAIAQLEPLAQRGGAGATAFKARLGLIRAGREQPARAHTTDASAERAMDDLEAEARAAFCADRAAREPDQRVPLLDAAIRTLLSAVGGAGEEDRGRLARAYDKIAGLIPPDAPLGRLPAEASLARAIARVRQSGMDNRQARDEALGLLTGVADRADATSPLRSRARWERAVIAGAGDDPLAEIDALAAVCRLDAESDHAAVAAERIATLFARRPDQSGAGSEVPADPWRAKLSALRDAHALLLRRDAPGADRWRQEAVRLAIREMEAHDDAESIDRATRLFELIDHPGASPTVAKALTDGIWRELERRRAAAAEWTARDSPTRARQEWESLAPIASRAAAWSRAHDAPREPEYTLLLGEALNGVADRRAIATLGTLAGGPIDRPESPHWTRYKLALAHAQRSADDHAKALATLHDIADRFEGAPGSSQRQSAYWEAWCEIIAIQQSQNAGGQRSADIRVQIKRLEMVDPKLGGPPYAERIKKIRATVGE